MGLLRGAAAWGCEGAQERAAAQGRSSAGLRKGEVAWGCAGAEQRGAAQGRSVGLRMTQRGVAQGHNSVGLRRGASAWGCAGAKQHGAAEGRSSVGPRARVGGREKAEASAQGPEAPACRANSGTSSGAKKEGGGRRFWCWWVLSLGVASAALSSMSVVTVGGGGASGVGRGAGVLSGVLRSVRRVGGVGWGRSTDVGPELAPGAWWRAVVGGRVLVPGLLLRGVVRMSRGNCIGTKAGEPGAGLRGAGGGLSPAGMAGMPWGLVVAEAPHVGCVRNHGLYFRLRSS